MTSRFTVLAVSTTAVLAALSVPAAAADPLVAERFEMLTRGSQWTLVDTIPLDFDTYHPQGMVRIGDKLYLSSVNIIEPTQRFDTPQNGFDRTVGVGEGHLFELDLEGHLLRDVVIGEGDTYHPGGIDFDGTDIWVPVAEYRPNSAAIIYRVNVETMTATEMFRFADHVGGLVHATDTQTLHGVSWGSRRSYAWPLDADLLPTNGDVAPADLMVLNPSHYIDYQDCHYVGGTLALCSGLAGYRMSPESPSFPLGGIELVDLELGVPIHQVPVQLWTDTGRPMTQNPFWAEPNEAGGLRFYFIPEDGQSRMFVYDVTP